jgi:hypothetical protein
MSCTNHRYCKTPETTILIVDLSGGYDTMITSRHLMYNDDDNTNMRNCSDMLLTVTGMRDASVIILR